MNSVWPLFMQKTCENREANRSDLHYDRQTQNCRNCLLISYQVTTILRLTIEMQVTFGFDVFNKGAYLIFKSIFHKALNLV